MQYNTMGGSIIGNAPTGPSDCRRGGPEGDLRDTDLGPPIHLKESIMEKTEYQPKRMCYGRTGWPERFWSYVIAETPEAEERLRRHDYVTSNIQPKKEQAS